jgi:glycogen(starch) synthase
MRVLFWSGTFWPKIGGVEVHAAKLLPALQERGHEFMVITPRRSAEQDDKADYMGSPIYRFDFNDPALFSDMKMLRETRGRIAQLKREFRPDIVHLNALDAGMFFHHITAREFPAPMMVTLHGDWPHVSAAQDSLISQTLRHSDWVVACSQAILKRGFEFAAEIRPRSSIVYNGMDRPGLAPTPLPSDPPVLLCLGRTAVEKGVDIALEAFAEVEARRPEVRLLIAGDGEDRAALERRSADLGLTGVEFLGWTAPDAVPELLNRVTAVLMPSRQDSFPLTALETAIMERPIIASEVGGLPEIVLHGETGLLVPAEQPPALSDAIFELLGDMDRARRMGVAARRRVERDFSWSGHVEAYDRVYHTLARQKAGK